MVFSGSGRHRRPTQADRAVVAAGVAGAGLALPLLSATGAHAAPVTTWDSVAQCASGGDWTMNTGDGTYGGLRLTLRQWVAYGGDEYAAQADHATKDQQIAVAEKVLADQGPTAWPTCASKAGLAVPMPTPTPTATTAATPTPTVSATPSATPSTVAPSTAAPSTVASAPSSPTTSASPSPTASATPTPSPTATPSATPTPTASPTAAPTPLPAPAAPTSPAAPSTNAPDTYTVVPGDTLYGIADTHRVGGWQHLYQQNLGTVGANPDLILPGQVLHLG